MNSKLSLAVTIYGFYSGSDSRRAIECVSVYRDYKKISQRPTGVIYPSLRAAEAGVASKNRVAALTERRGGACEAAGLRRHRCQPCR